MTKTVLITGCSSGFGREAARQFRDKGWNVVATMRNPTAWTEPGADNVLVLPLDVTDEVSIDLAVDRSVEHFGRLDCVVNNAGQAIVSVIESTPLDYVRRMFETNFYGVARVMQKVIPYFRGVGGGRFVTIGSSSAIAPEPLCAFYSASKFAVEGFIEAARYELSPFEIVLKLVEPGFVKETSILGTTLETAKELPIPNAYKDYFDATLHGFLSDMPYRFATEREVAANIVAAAEDSTNTFRFTVGEDAHASAFMRRETSEPVYDSWSRVKYGGDFASAANTYFDLRAAKN